MWADLFAEVSIAAPCRQGAVPDDCLAFTRDNISIVPQLETGGERITARLIQLLLLPVHLWKLSFAMLKADAIHIRCPGNLGLLGVLLAPLFSRYLVAKYAGQWNRFDDEPLTWRLQKGLLRSRWWQGPVTVYGHWPNQPKQIIPFFTSIMTNDQVAHARAAAANKKTNQPLKLLFVGRLSKEKNVDVILDAIGRLKEDGIAMEATIVGDGPQFEVLQNKASSLGLGKYVTFAGAMSFDQVLDFYSASDVLVLVSKTEGWPKTVVEAMAFGLICVGINQGALPDILGEGRGILVSEKDPDSLADVLRSIAAEPQKLQLMRAEASAWAQKFSLEGLRDALKALLTERWGVSFGAVPADATHQRSFDLSA
jgi:glycosyltransferase involved in cell wall biosynthesis